jgi:DNA-binding GntR family transcriptional regulator
MVYIFELREVLEGLVARRAAAHITDSQVKELRQFFSRFSRTGEITDYKGYSREDRRFHSFIIEVGAKEFLKSILQTTNIISFSYQFISSEGLIRPPAETITEHLVVIEAICDHDSKAAEELMRRHFKKSAALLRRLIEEEKKTTGRRTAPSRPESGRAAATERS